MSENVLTDQRPAIVRIRQSEEGGEAKVTITLAWKDAEYLGEAAGSTEWTYRPRLVGEATLRAVERVAENRINLSLAAIATTPLGEAQVAMAQVKMEGDDEPLVGSALLGTNDEAAATVKAVLDAINRRLSRVL
jgi:hypothetical protein